MSDRSAGIQDGRADLQAGQQENLAARQEGLQDTQAARQETRAEQLPADRQEHREDTREDWQDYHEDVHHDDYWYDWGYVGVGTAVVIGGAAVIGSTVSSDTYDDLACTPTEIEVEGVTYMQCGDTWYMPTYSGDEVKYIVVEPPAKQ